MRGQQGKNGQMGIRKVTRVRPISSRDATTCFWRGPEQPQGGSENVAFGILFGVGTFPGLGCTPDRVRSTSLVRATRCQSRCSKGATRSTPAKRSSPRAGTGCLSLENSPILGAAPAWLHFIGILARGPGWRMVLTIVFGHFCCALGRRRH